jgi:hypothetical protein
MGDDYMVVAFIRAEGKTYYAWITFSDVSPAEPDEEVPAQPLSPPEPEINPVTDRPVSPDDYAEPTGYDGNRPGNGGNGGGNNGGTDNGGNGGGTSGTPDYAALTEEERLEFFRWDVFDYGMAEAGISDNSVEYWDGFMAWYIGEQFTWYPSAADVQQYMDAASAEGYLEQNFAALGLFEYLKLYPTYEMRKVYGADGDPSEFYLFLEDGENLSQWTQSANDPDNMKEFVDRNQDGYHDDSPYDTGAPIVSGDGFWDGNDDSWWSDGDFGDPDGDW